MAWDLGVRGVQDLRCTLLNDKVLLQIRNLDLRSTGTKELLPKWSGPFAITKIVNEVVVELHLPPTLRMHLTFHTNLVKPQGNNG